MQDDKTEQKVPVAAGGSTTQLFYQELATALEKDEVKLLKLDKIPALLRPIKKKNGRKESIFVRPYRTLGSDGEIKTIDILKVREMTDPLNYTIRDWLTQSAFQDPTISPSLQQRNNAFFADGFDIILELKSKTKLAPVTPPGNVNQTPQNQPALPPQSGTVGSEAAQLTDDTQINKEAGKEENLAPGENKPQDESQMTPEEIQAEVNKYNQQYGALLQKIRDWAESPDINLMEKMKRAHISVIVQGRSLIIIIPMLTQLAPNQLPVSLRVITWQDTGQVIVDTLLWKVIGVRTFFINKNLALPEEMIYITGKNWGLKRESDFYGSSELEAFIQMSRINKKILNYDFAKAAEAGYITKLILTAETGGNPTDRQNQIQTLINQIISQGTDIVGLEYGATVTPVPITVDAPMLQYLSTTIDDRLIAGAGATKAMLGRTEGLTRDNATIQEIEFIRNVRTPDEKLIKSAFENQLLTPLLAHLAGVSVDELPVRAIIKRRQPEDEAVDPRMEDKGQELQEASKGNTQESLIQEDAKTFGSSGNKFWVKKIPGLDITPANIFTGLMRLPKPKLDSILNEIGFPGKKKATPV